MNKKGFTLVELLAVIVILALIMVFAVPQILNVMNDSKKKNFQLYAQRFMQSVSDYYQSKGLLNEQDKITTKYNGKICLRPQDIGVTATGSYQLFVAITPSDQIINGVNQTAYNIYMTDGSFAYNGTDMVTVQTNSGAISSNPDDIAAARTAIGQCVATTTPPVTP